MGAADGDSELKKLGANGNGKKTSQARLITVNANCSNTLEGVFDFCKVSFKNSFIFAQELNLASGGVDRFSERMYRLGWKCAIVPSVPTKEDGLSAGVLIAAPTCCGMTHLDHGMLAESWDCSTQCSPGRLCVAWIDAVVKGGIMAGSLYLWHTEGLSERNRGLLNAFAEQVFAYSGPWSLQGDFNMSPNVLLDSEWGAAWLKLIGGTVVYDSQVGSCKTPQGRSTIDWFVIDRRLATEVSAETLLDESVCSPHSPVVLSVGKNARQHMVMHHVVPKPWPCKKPIGCPTEPPMWPKPLALSAGVFAQQSIDAYWAEIGGCTELEINTYFNFEGATM